MCQMLTQTASSDKQPALFNTFTKVKQTSKVTVRQLTQGHKFCTKTSAHPEWLANTQNLSYIHVHT